MWDPCCDPDASSFVPGILGMNVIRRCYHKLFGVLGSSLFESHFVSGAPGPVMAALQKRHQSSAQVISSLTGAVRVRGKRVVQIHSGMMKLVTVFYSNLPSPGCQQGCWLPRAC